jgi:hypothetical protein
MGYENMLKKLFHEQLSADTTGIRNVSNVQIGREVFGGCLVE